MYQPQMHISHRVVNVEVIMQVHTINKLPRVLVKQDPLEYCDSLHLTSLLAPLQDSNVFVVTDHLLDEVCLVDLMVCLHALHCSIQIKWFKPWPSRPKVLLIIHPVVNLLLVPIQIRDSPIDFVPHRLGLLKVGRL